MQPHPASESIQNGPGGAAETSHHTLIAFVRYIFFNGGKNINVSEIRLNTVAYPLFIVFLYFESVARCITSCE